MSSSLLICTNLANLCQNVIRMNMWLFEMILWNVSSKCNAFYSPKLVILWNRAHEKQTSYRLWNNSFIFYSVRWPWWANYMTAQYSLYLVFIHTLNGSTEIDKFTQFIQRTYLYHRLLSHKCLQQFLLWQRRFNRREWCSTADKLWQLPPMLDSPGLCPLN